MAELWPTVYSINALKAQSSVDEPEATVAHNRHDAALQWSWKFIAVSKPNGGEWEIAGKCDVIKDGGWPEVDQSLVCNTSSRSYRRHGQTSSSGVTLLGARGQKQNRFHRFLWEARGQKLSENAIQWSNYYLNTLATKTAIVCCDRLLLAVSANYLSNSHTHSCVR